MTRREQVLAEARRIVKERGGLMLIEVLADMVVQGAGGICHGFVRTPPDREVEITLKGVEPIE